MSMLNTSDSHLPFPILIGDIGGTNARFSLLVDAFAEPVHFPPFKTGDFGTIDEALLKGVFGKTSVRPRSAILAVAGPIRGDEIPLTNCGWVVRPHDMLSSLGLEDVLVINDFEAQALAVSALADEDLVRIGGGSIRPMSSRVVLGPGTGLGRCGRGLCAAHLVPGAGRRRPCRSRSAQ